FAEIQENFEALVQRAYRSQIVIVSPSLLMLSIQVLQGVLKDQRMREQAHLIQGEVVKLMADVNRLDDRVRRLQQHFTQANRDIEQIITSTEKVTKRGQRIEQMEFGEQQVEALADENEERAVRAADQRSGQLRLRVVDEDE